jgi:GT2 family glycosyltransferase
MVDGDRFPPVAVVIPTHNRRDDLLICVASVEALDYPEYEIIVVDDGSTDGSVTALRAEHPQLTVIALEGNAGAVAASNAGFRRALAGDAAYVLRLDSDTVLAPDFLSELVAVAEREPDVGALMGKIYYYDRPQQIWSLGARRKSWFYDVENLGRDRFDSPTLAEITEVDYIWSTGLLLTRRALTETGGFDADFFVYYEEMDLSERLRSAGFRLLMVPTARMWHRIGETSQSAWVAYNWARGKMLFYRKHSRGLHRLLLILYAYLYAFLRALRPKAGAGNRGPLQAALAGLTAGLRLPLSS